MDFHTTTFDAIGVTNSVTVTDPAALPAAGEIARGFVADLDHACSRFRDDSELARLNTAGGAVVSPLLLEAIDVALDAARSTDGLVDPTVGASLVALGYDRDFDVLVRRDGFELVAAAGWRSVRIDRRASSVRLRPGTQLDLGATAKAFAADAIAAAVQLETGGSVLISLGGDVAVAGEPVAWPILVTDSSRDAGADGQVVEIREGGLATSSTTVRRWVAGTVELHHIVDPATGAPAAETWRTVSVAAESCTAANVAATAAIVSGDRAPSWLGARGVAARLVRRDGVIVTVGGWPS